ncbi:MAG: CDP-alcohol phosphatidyltransferase family protein [Bacteroidales bacterium]|nr:CDP-alcohol phosphatidyltransferase family protein [Bacteroidales bacterium]
MIRRQIPNLITLGNLLCGVLACNRASIGCLDTAALYICLGIFLDFFDGLAARLLKVPSAIGKELDSLADVVTSGVAPCLILFYLVGDSATSNNSEWIVYLSCLAFPMPLFSAYRLAKFNLDTRQSHSFLGLPVPANALIWVGIALYVAPWNFNSQLDWNPIIQNDIFLIGLIILSLITNVLMISEMPMFSLKFNFKDMSWKSNGVQYIFLIGCVAIVAITRQWYAISIIILWYIILSAITQRKHAE